MTRISKEQQYGIAGTVIVHLLLFLLLWFLVIDKPLPQDEVGVPVILGNTLDASGDAYRYTEVNVAPVPSPVTTDVSGADTGTEEPLITQNNEETVAVDNNDKKRKDSEKSAEQLEAERRQREAEEIARIADSRIAGAFGKGSTMADKGTATVGSGNQGSVQGNGQVGVVTGAGGYGAFDLHGRSLGEGGLPRPSYNVQDEGRVVVNITVNPDGQVIQTTINSRTNTANASLRRAALEAARKAVFNKVTMKNNQTGTITYYFKLR